MKISVAANSKVGGDQLLGAGFYWEPWLSNKKNTTKGHIEEVMAIKLRKSSGLDYLQFTIHSWEYVATFLLHNLTLHNADEVRAIWTKYSFSVSNFAQSFVFFFLFYSKYLFHFRNPQAASVYQVVLRGQMV